MPFRNTLISTVAALSVIFAAFLVGVWPMLGAHPFWSLSATGIGSLIGTVVFLFLAFGSGKRRWKPRSIVIVLLIILTVAFLTTTLGKREFVGSYAENRMAGRIWYYGFIAFIAALQASAAFGIHALLNRKT